MAKETQKVKALYHLSVMLMTAGVFGNVMQRYKAAGFGWQNVLYSLAVGAMYAYCLYLIRRGTRESMKAAEMMPLEVAAAPMAENGKCLG